jgi:hypothetical protein
VSRSLKSGETNGAENNQATNAQEKCLAFERGVYEPLELVCTDLHDKKTFFPESTKSSWRESSAS